VPFISSLFVRLPVALLLLVAGSGRAAADDGPLLRVFLKDGTTIACYGEYARVDDRVVLSLPLGKKNGKSQLQLVSVPAARVDWHRTERYRESARAARYAATRGEQDFTQLTAAVATTLNDIARTTDPVRRLELAEQARSQLAGWGRDHYNYRIGEVREIAGLLEETISELRATAGRSDFDLNFVAIVEPPPAEKLLPDPTPAEGLAQAIAMVDLADGPAERIALLENTLRVIRASAGLVNGASLESARRYVERRLQDERTADERYGRLTREVSRQAREHAARGDVRGIESLMRVLERRDRRLGRKRPQLMAAIMATLSYDLRQARTLRLARDQYESRLPAYRAYERLVRGTFSDLAAAGRALDDIRALAGPDHETLLALQRQVDAARRRLDGIVPPAGMTEVHELLHSACRLANTAAQVRQEAVALGSLERAWSASAAAAGAQLLVTRARDEMGRLMAPLPVR
jgi:hypothetical protein